MANTIVSQNLPDSTVLQKGSGTSTASPSGVLSVSTVLVGTAADTNEADLITYTVPANTLISTGKGVRLTAWGSFANNANNKTLKLYWNGTNCVTVGPTASANTTWRVEIDVVRTGTTNAKVKGCAIYSTVTATGGNLAVTSDFTTALIIKVTGTNGTASASDITMDFGRVEVLN